MLPQVIFQDIYLTSFISTLIIFFVVSWVFFFYFSGKPEPDIPLYADRDNAFFSFNKRWMFDSANLLREGYYKFYDKPFGVWTSQGEQVSLPPKYVDGLKMLPDHTLTSQLRDFMQVAYTMAPVGPEMLDYVDAVISSDLNRNLAKVFPNIQGEIDAAFPAELPVCQDWTPITAYGTVLRLICRISGRMSVGPSLNRNEEWIDISSEWTRNVFLSAVKLKMLPAFLRPIGSYFIPEIKKCRHQNIRARELLQPIIQKREQEELLPGYEKPNDAIEWLRDVVPDEDRKNYTFFGIGQLAIGALSIHTVSHLTTNVVLNLAAYPEYVSILREEYESVKKEYGEEFMLESMEKLKKMDSFLNETLRCNNLSLVSFQRKALRPVTLYDGTILPAGTLIFAPANAISTDNSIFPDGDTFDGLRFYKLRESSPQAKNKHQLTSINSTQLHFGAGRHACPGRWYASAEIKLIIVSLLSKYDIKLKEGEKRPESIKFQHRNAPDPKAQVLIRERPL
ncbi:cytochrome P450 [Leptodontidium sp. MPI-SDFR-AT-0119]|nr:cytochrome P450 [Leptodontidium sp. MPI-SDFR-AT-0119]